MVEVAGKPILTHCFEQLVDLGAEELLVVVGYEKQVIIEHYGDEFDGVPITYTHQREQRGLAHALLTVEEHVDDDFMLMLGDNIFKRDLADVVQRGNCIPYAYSDPLGYYGLRTRPVVVQPIGNDGLCIRQRGGTIPDWGFQRSLLYSLSVSYVSTAKMANSIYLDYRHPSSSWM